MNGLRKNFNKCLDQFIDNIYETKEDAKIALQNLEALAMDLDDRDPIIQEKLNIARKYFNTKYS